MKDALLSKAIKMAVTATPLEAGVEHMKEAVADAVEDGVNAAKRAVKQGRRAAEDLVDDAKYQVKRHPLNAVGISFSVGLGLGALIGILLARSGHRGSK